MVNKYKKLMVISLIFNLILLVVLGGISYKYKEVKNSSVAVETLQHNIMTSGFNQLDKSENNKVVFLGDSLTEFCQWDELLQNKNIVNRGIGGDTIEGVIKRLASIEKSKPKELLLMIGINNILQSQKQSILINNYKSLLKSINEKIPNTRIVIESILPVNNKISGSKAENTVINELNQNLQKIAQINKMDYVDINSKFLDKDGQLDASYTIDGIHLNAKGYAIWKDVIEKYVTK